MIKAYSRKHKTVETLAERLRAGRTRARRNPRSTRLRGTNEGQRGTNEGRRSKNARRPSGIFMPVRSLAFLQGRFDVETVSQSRPAAVAGSPESSGLQSFNKTAARETRAAALRHDRSPGRDRAFGMPTSSRIF
jgi:hypothetical protein